MLEQPYQATCAICNTTLFSANDCHNANPYTQGFACQSCYTQKIKPMKLYSIVRFYKKPHKPNKVIKTGLTLQQAQQHCQDPKTSTKDWFDGYTAQ
jgi:hypothetical protein